MKSVGHGAQRPHGSSLMNKTINNVSQNITTILPGHENGIVLQSGSSSRARSSNKQALNTKVTGGSATVIQSQTNAVGQSSPWTPDRASTLLVKSSSALNKKNAFTGLSSRRNNYMGDVSPEPQPTG